MLAPGTRVRVLVTDPPTHTRAPRYVRGHVGVVIEEHGVHPLPDTLVASGGRQTQLERVYAVRFDAGDLWGEGDGSPQHTVTVNLWHSYLEAAP